MILRSAALALTLTFGFAGLAEAKHKPVAPKHKVAKVKAHSYNAKKANKAAAKALAKRRKQHRA
jgi:hypothetical protein